MVELGLQNKAIDEAAEKKVDIISMSHASKNYSDRLRQAILNARKHDIVMLSSQGDRGGNQEKVWPADDEGVMSISSYTNLGAKRSVLLSRRERKGLNGAGLFEAGGHRFRQLCRHSTCGWRCSTDPLMPHACE